MNEHHDFQQQAVSDPEQQNQFHAQKEDQRTFEAEALRDHESKDCTENVTKGIHDSVAGIAERRGVLAISIDDEVGIFKNFPGRSHGN